METSDHLPLRKIFLGLWLAIFLSIAAATGDWFWLRYRVEDLELSVAERERDIAESYAAARQELRALRQSLRQQHLTEPRSKALPQSRHPLLPAYCAILDTYGLPLGFTQLTVTEQPSTAMFTVDGVAAAKSRQQAHRYLRAYATAVRQSLRLPEDGVQTMVTGPSSQPDYQTIRVFVTLARQF